MLALQSFVSYHGDIMDEIKLPNSQKRLIEMIRKVPTGTDLSKLDQKALDVLNDAALPNRRCLRHTLSKHTGHVSKKTFIIPVDGAAITGYLFEKESTAESDGLSPLIIFYHGGGWIWGNMELYAYVCARIVNATGARILSVDYRLAPKYKFPIPLDDCYSSLLWAAKGAKYWRTDPDRIFVMGDCAGGNLAAAVCRKARDKKGPHIAGQILLYPITDGRMRTASYEKYATTPTLTSKEVSFYISNYMVEPKDIMNAAFSPLLAKDQSRLPQALIIGAEIDPLHDDGMLYADALASADTPVQYLEVKGSLHGFITIPEAKGNEETECAIQQFVYGRSVGTIVLTTKKQMERDKKQHLKEQKQKDGLHGDITIIK
jgi:acetyl esterase